MFENRAQLWKYVAVRTASITACKIERTYLSGYVKKMARGRQEAPDASELALGDLSPEVAADIEALRARAEQLLKNPPPILALYSDEPEALAYRRTLMETKGEIEDLFAELRAIKAIRGKVPFPERPALRDLLYRVQRELGTGRRTRATEHYHNRHRASRRQELPFSTRQTIQFLVNLLEKHPPDLSTDPMTRKTLEEITAWATDAEPVPQS